MSGAWRTGRRALSRLTAVQWHQLHSVKDLINKEAGKEITVRIFRDSGQCSSGTVLNGAEVFILAVCETKTVHYVLWVIIALYQNSAAVVKCDCMPVGNICKYIYVEYSTRVMYLGMREKYFHGKLVWKAVQKITPGKGGMHKVWMNCSCTNSSCCAGGWWSTLITQRQNMLLKKQSKSRRAAHGQMSNTPVSNTTHKRIKSKTLGWARAWNLHATGMGTRRRAKVLGTLSINLFQYLPCSHPVSYTERRSYATCHILWHSTSLETDPWLLETRRPCQGNRKEIALKGVPVRSVWHLHSHQLSAPEINASMKKNCPPAQCCQH